MCWKDLHVQVIFRVEHVYLVQTKWGKLPLRADRDVPPGRASFWAKKSP